MLFEGEGTAAVAVDGVAIGTDTLCYGMNIRTVHKVCEFEN